MNTSKVTERESNQACSFFGLASSPASGQIDYVTRPFAKFSLSLITCMTNVPVLYSNWVAVPHSLIT